VRIGTIDINKLRGLFDKALGLGKELLGTVVGSDRLQEEGEAQQSRATEQLRALRQEVKAQRKESEANIAEQRQKAAQRAKAS
jgi:uncharacterized protein YjbJ (UPF0337 family)